MISVPDRLIRISAIGCFKGDMVILPCLMKKVKCTFFGVVPIDIQRFEESGVSLVECPDCGRAWTLAPRSGILRFKSHDKRKVNTPVTSRRWARGEEKTGWEVMTG